MLIGIVNPRWVLLPSRWFALCMWAFSVVLLGFLMEFDPSTPKDPKTEGMEWVIFWIWASLSGSVWGLRRVAQNRKIEINHPSRSMPNAVRPVISLDRSENDSSVLAKAQEAPVLSERLELEASPEEVEPQSDLANAIADERERRRKKKRDARKPPPEPKEVSPSLAAWKEKEARRAQNRNPTIQPRPSIDDLDRDELKSILNSVLDEMVVAYEGEQDWELEGEPVKKTKLKPIKRSAPTQPRPSKKRVSFDAPGMPRANSGEFVFIEYVDSQGEITEREVRNWSKTRIHLEGHCMLRKQKRLFKITQIITWGEWG